MKRIKLPPEGEPITLKPKSKRVKLYDEGLPVVPEPKNPVDERYTYDDISKQQYKWAMLYTGECQRDGVKAAIKVGYQASKASHHVKELKNNPKVMALVNQLDEQRLAKMRYDGDRAARIHYLRAYHPRFKTFFNAFIPCCRHCHGTNFEYQRTHSEFEDAFDKYMKGRKAQPFDQRGGSDYNPNTPPNPSCPNCFGKGDIEHPKITFKGLDDLPPEAEALISGVKIKDGKIQEIVFHDSAPSLQFLQPLQVAWEKAQSDANRLDLEKLLSGLSIEELDQIIEQANENQIEYIEDVGP